MPVAFKAPAQPLPPAMGVAPGNSPVAAGSGATGSFDFLALLANMNALAASVLPGTTGATDSLAVGDGAQPAEPLETGEPEAKDGDSDDDTADDDELLAALQLTGVPVAAPIAQSTRPADAAASDAMLDALSGGQKDSSQTASAPVPAHQPAAKDSAPQIQIKAQDLLPPSAAAAAPPENLTKKADPEALAAASVPESKGTLPTQLHALAAHAQTATDADGPRELRPPVGTHAWTRQLGDELAWMMQQGRDAASLKLSPEHLGPLEVRISMQDGGASVWFGASHADTRAALEQALPKLREMFASQGLALADAGVFKEAPRQQPRSPSLNSNATGNEAVTEVTSARRTTAGLRLLDTYA